LFCGIKSSIAWTQLRKAKRRRNYHHPHAKVPQTLGHLCLSGELGNQVLRTLNRFFPRVVSVMGSQRSHTLDEIRHDGTEQLQATANKPVLRNARWCLLKRPENLTDRQTTSLQEILKHNLKTLRAWPSREDFQRLMSVAEMLRRHKPLLLNWF
jgi:carbonic anhydrase